MVQGPELPHPNAGHCMVQLSDKRIMLLGSEAKNAGQSVTIFDANKQSFSSTTNNNNLKLKFRRSASACTLFNSLKHNNRSVVLAVGGTGTRTSEVLDHTQNNAAWEQSKCNSMIVDFHKFEQAKLISIKFPTRLIFTHLGMFLYGRTRKLANSLNGIRKNCIYFDGYRKERVIIRNGNFVF